LTCFVYHNFHIDLAKQSPMVITNVLKNLECKADSGTPLYLRNDAEEIGNCGNQIESKQSFIFCSVSTRRAISVLFGKMELETSDLTL